MPPTPRSDTQEGLKLWLDDVRPPPEGWTWARTNDEARELLRSGEVVEISLDHDLGYDGVEFPEDPDELAEVMFDHMPDPNTETGYDLVNWMLDNDLVPGRITIHSWNPDGARYMAERLLRAGYGCTLAPFRVGGR